MENNTKITECTRINISLWKRWRLHLLIALIAFLIFCIWYIFPQPDYKLWPPKVKNERYIVYVTIDDYHSCINFPDYSMGLLQEWHMGSKEWYLKKDFKIMDLAFRAAKGKVAAVIRFGVFHLPYWQRNKISRKHVYSFWLSETGFKRLNSSLHRYRSPNMIRKGEFWYFPYKRGYHLIQNCNHFTVSVLKAAGLPLRELLAQEGNSLTWQLERCKRIQETWLLNNSQSNN